MENRTENKTEHETRGEKTNTSLNTKTTTNTRKTKQLYTYTNHLVIASASLCYRELIALSSRVHRLFFSHASYCFYRHRNRLDIAAIVRSSASSTNIVCSCTARLIRIPLQEQDCSAVLNYWGIMRSTVFLFPPLKGERP